jgi:hypothetical protein
MAITYTWDIENVDVLPSYNNHENVVFRVVWNCKAEDSDGNTKDQSGVVELDIDSTAENFIPVDQLTKQNIIDWVKATVAVSVIEKGLIPATKTISFRDTSEPTITVAQQLAALADKADTTPQPDSE